MNYAASLLMPFFINSNFSVTFRTRVDKEVKFLIEDARLAIAKAKEESKYGNIAKDLALTNGTSNKVRGRNLKVIALWHYQRGIEKYREAIKYLKIAAIYDLPEKYKKYVALQINEAERLLKIALEQKEARKDSKRSKK
jgi:hypothetical protein